MRRGPSRSIDASHLTFGWLRRAFRRFRARSRREDDQRRSAEARARFWAEVREGEREAEDAVRR